MGRPKKTIQRKPSGIFQVILWVDGKRHYKSLETKDEVTATKRAAQSFIERKGGLKVVIPMFVTRIRSKESLHCSKKTGSRPHHHQIRASR